MSLSTEALANRTMSSYPISIGTSLALESLGDGPNPPYDPERVKPPHIDLTGYTEVWINLFCLFRNIMGSLDKDHAGRVMPNDLSDTLEFEVDVIRNVISDISHGRAKAVFYASDYRNLEKEYPHARVRVDNTDKQKIYTSLLTNTINKFFTSQVKSDHMFHFSLKLKPKERHNALIITNYAFDLLSHKNFNKLDLLESHTGVLKGRSLWYTKYIDGKDLARIPYNEAFLQIFGDSATFYPFPIKTRREIIDIAEKYKWTQTTSDDRIRLSLSGLMDPYLIAILKEML